VKQVDLPQEMQRAIAAQAEAERDCRAKIVAAEGEFQASAKRCRQPQLWRPRRLLGLRGLSSGLQIRSGWLLNACAQPAANWGRWFRPAASIASAQAASGNIFRRRVRRTAILAADQIGPL